MCRELEVELNKSIDLAHIDVVKILKKYSILTDSNKISNKLSLQNAYDIFYKDIIGKNTHGIYEAYLSLTQNILANISEELLKNKYYIYYSPEDIECFKNSDVTYKKIILTIGLIYKKDSKEYRASTFNIISTFDKKIEINFSDSVAIFKEDDIQNIYLINKEDADDCIKDIINKIII